MAHIRIVRGVYLVQLSSPLSNPFGKTWLCSVWIDMILIRRIALDDNYSFSMPAVLGNKDEYVNVEKKHFDLL
jgi:hypothetical protein